MSEEGHESQEHYAGRMLDCTDSVGFFLNIPKDKAPVILLVSHGINGPGLFIAEDDDASSGSALQLVQESFAPLAMVLKYFWCKKGMFQQALSTCRLDGISDCSLRHAQINGISSDGLCWSCLGRSLDLVYSNLLITATSRVSFNPLALVQWLFDIVHRRTARIC